MNANKFFAPYRNAVTRLTKLHPNDYSIPMSKAPCIHYSLTPLLLALVVLTGCDQSGSTSTTSYKLDFFGIKKGWKTISRTENGVTRKLETTINVDLQNGQITKFPPLAVIKLEESGDHQKREAELRENTGKLELWIKDNGTFRRSKAAEDAWLNTFLIEITKSKPQ